MDKTKAEREENVGAQKKNQQWRAPDEIAELSYEFFKFLHAVPLQKTRQLEIRFGESERKQNLVGRDRRARRTQPDGLAHYGISTRIR